jgi:hypothetical protein
VPGGASGNFTSFTSPPDISGSTVVFRGSYSGGNGIYSVDLAGGAITTVADITTTVPEGDGATFISLLNPNIDGDIIAFKGSFMGVSGIYLMIDGELVKVVDTLDLLDGKTVTSFTLGEGALNGGNLSFRADFSDSSVGLFTTTFSLASVPEPSTYAMIAGAAALGWCLRRRQRTAA